jgi:hypothetical protein
MPIYASYGSPASNFKRFKQHLAPKTLVPCTVMKLWQYPSRKYSPSLMQQLQVFFITNFKDLQSLHKSQLAFGLQDHIVHNRSI